MLLFFIGHTYKDSHTHSHTCLPFARAKHIGKKFKEKQGEVVLSQDSSVIPVCRDIAKEHITGINWAEKYAQQE